MFLKNLLYYKLFGMALYRRGAWEASAAIALVMALSVAPHSASAFLQVCVAMLTRATRAATTAV
jgi:hypothetical protein